MEAKVVLRKPSGSPERVPVCITRNSINADLAFLGTPRPADSE
ncbi:MAG: hypothetical protein AAF809_15490 [Bacteroidota bacterium]